MKASAANRWYRFVYALLCKPVCLLMNVHVDNREIRDLNEPFVAISNHPSFFDWAFAARALENHSPHFIVNRLYFRGVLGFLLRKIGAEPRSLMTADTVSVRRMLRLAQTGKSMCIFPDPSISLTGDTEGEIAPGTYKLMKKMGLTVIGLRHEGSFHTKPPWGRGLRRGRVDTRAFILFTPEELRTLSEAEGEARLQDLVIRRVLEPRERGVSYKSRHMAEKLEKLFFLCPHCGKQGQLTTKGNRVFCDCCGRTAVMNEYYELLWDSGGGPQNLSQWYAYQRQAVLRLLEEREYVVESDTMFHRFTDETGFLPVGPGHLRLDTEGLHYEGQDGETLFYPIESIRPLFQNLSAGRIQLFYGAECHEFELPDKTLPPNFWRLSAEHLRAMAPLETK